MAKPSEVVRTTYPSSPRGSIPAVEFQIIRTRASSGGGAVVATYAPLMLTSVNRPMRAACEFPSTTDVTTGKQVGSQRGNSLADRVFGQLGNGVQAELTHDVAPMYFHGTH